ncbi:unnamed protein product [Malus baccata var. baccata]
MGQYKSLLFLLIFLTLSRSGMSWFWSSSSGNTGNNPPQNLQISSDIFAEFSMDSLNDEKGTERVNNARRKLVGANSCWHDAYRGIFGACSEMAADDNDKRKRFAWDLSSCFQKDSGRSPFPMCHETFEQKQASMFVALDRLFALHDALLVESRSMKAVFFYFISMLAIYMLTSTKQTYPVRHWLYLFLCLAFLLEFAVLRFASNGIEQRTRWDSGVRNVYVLYAALHLLYACWKYKDYERLNYDMLQKLTEEVISLRKNADQFSWESDDESDWSAFVDKDISDGIEHLTDSNHFKEEVGDNLRAVSSYTGRYNLRSRTRNRI